MIYHYDSKRNLSLNIKQNPKAIFILDLKFVPQLMIFNVLMAPPHMQIKTKLKHSTTSLLVAIFTQENLSSILSFTLDTTVPLLQTVTVSPNL